MKSIQTIDPSILADHRIHATMAPIDERVAFLELLRGKCDGYLAGHRAPGGPEFIDDPIGDYNRYPAYGAPFFTDFMLPAVFT